MAQKPNKKTTTATTKQAPEIKKEPTPTSKPPVVDTPAPKPPVVKEKEKETKKTADEQRMHLEHFLTQKSNFYVYSGGAAPARPMTVDRLAELLEIEKNSEKYEILSVWDNSITSYFRPIRGAAAVRPATVEDIVKKLQ